MIAVLVDENVSDDFADALTNAGVDVFRLHDEGLKGTKDEELLPLALEERRMLLTNDVDFLRMASESQRLNEQFAPIVYWSQQRRTIAELLVRIMPLLQTDDYEALCCQVHYV